MSCHAIGDGMNAVGLARAIELMHGKNLEEAEQLLERARRGELA